jgi:hypothetical protein
MFSHRARQGQSPFVAITGSANDHRAAKDRPTSCACQTFLQFETVSAAPGSRDGN